VLDCGCADFGGPPTKISDTCLYPPDRGEFSRDCAARRIGHLLLATHPHRTAIRERFYASTLSDHSHRRNLYSLPWLLCLANKLRSSETHFSCPIGPDLCSNVDTEFRESTF
jgi:hypothetical protein